MVLLIIDKSNSWIIHLKEITAHVGVSYTMKYVKTLALLMMVVQGNQIGVKFLLISISLGISYFPGAKGMGFGVISVTIGKKAVKTNMCHSIDWGLLICYVVNRLMSIPHSLCISLRKSTHKDRLSFQVWWL